MFAWGMAGKILGYMVTSKRIRANPNKTNAIVNMQSPKSLKEMQSLSGKLAALSHFFTRSAKRSLPFLETLKNTTKENKDEYRWTKEAEDAFQSMKRLIMELTSLTTPILKETLYIYLAASYDAVKELAFSLMHLSRRLRRYFEAHLIKVITDQPVKQVLSKAEASGKLAKYLVELGTYDITYMPRNAFKCQVIAYFLTKTPTGNRMKIQEICNVSDEEMAVAVWTLYTDKASRRKGAGVGLVFIDPSKLEYTYALRLNFKSSNNRVEYEAMFPIDGCKDHATRILLAHNAQDTREEIPKCDSYHIHGPVIKLPKTLMTSIMAPWSFYQWGLDILGPLPEAPGKAPGLVERANKSLMHGLKTRLGREKIGWVDELLNVLWAHRTMLKTSNGETPSA
ncbi:reverse transcriptase domain-containing protein [Tanacetum coccineum]